MRPKDFRAVIDDIQANLEGDPCELEIQLTTGLIYRGPWVQIGTGKYPRMIAIDIGDKPPVYVDVANIMTVTLTS